MSNVLTIKLWAEHSPYLIGRNDWLKFLDVHNSFIITLILLFPCNFKLAVEDDIDVVSFLSLAIDNLISLILFLSERVHQFLNLGFRLML